MTKSDVITALRSEADALRRLGATSLYLFGSRVREAATPESDVDLFVDYDESVRFSLVHLVGIKQHLENRLGLRVDLTTRDSLDPLLKARIESSAERVF
jgi:predicted nucleotidyltransferase